MSDLLKNLYSKRENEVPEAAPDPDCDWSQTFPVLFTFLTCTAFNGRPRETGTVLLMSEGGMRKAWVNDKHSGHSAFVSGKTFTDLFIAIESGLAANSLEWRGPKKSSGSGFPSSRK